MGKTYKHQLKYKLKQMTIEEMSNEEWKNTYYIEEINKEFKKDRRKIRRAKEKHALKNNKEIPTFRKCDRYDYF